MTLTVELTSLVYCMLFENKHFIFFSRLENYVTRLKLTVILEI